MERTIRFLKISLLSSTSNVKFLKELLEGSHTATELSEKGVKVKDIKLLEFLAFIRREETDLGIKYELTEKGKPIAETLIELLNKIEEGLPK